MNKGKNMLNKLIALGAAFGTVGAGNVAKAAYKDEMSAGYSESYDDEDGLGRIGKNEMGGNLSKGLGMGTLGKSSSSNSSSVMINREKIKADKMVSDLMLDAFTESINSATPLAGDENAVGVKIYNKNGLTKIKVSKTKNKDEFNQELCCKIFIENLNSYYNYLTSMDFRDSTDEDMSAYKFLDQKFASREIRTAIDNILRKHRKITIKDFEKLSKCKPDDEVKLYAEEFVNNYQLDRQDFPITRLMVSMR